MSPPPPSTRSDSFKFVIGVQTRAPSKMGPGGKVSCAEVGSPMCQKLIHQLCKQVAISQWETDGPPVDTNNAGTSEETKTPRSIQQWNQNLRSVQTKLAHAAQTNEDLKARLADNMRTLHNLESSLPHRVKNNDLRACPFAGPQHPSTYTLNYH